MKLNAAWWVALAAVAMTSCSSRHHDDKSNAKPAPAPAPAPVHDAAALIADAAADPDADLTWYRVEATIEDLGKVPFVIAIDRTKPEGWIVGPKERLPLVVVQREPMILRIPVRGVELRLSADGTSGRLRGQWVVKYYFKRDFDITAEPIAGPRPELVFPGADKPTVDFSGEWKIDIKEFGVGRAVFQQDASGALSGTIIPPEVGDLRYLTGRVIGDTGHLSAFDGIHGFLVELTSKDGKQLTGHWLISGIGDFTFTATRSDAPPTTHVDVSAHMAKGKTRLSLPALDKPPYLGNPVIVDYFGSWCPVCMDMTPELVRIHKEHADANLQIMSIALEPGDLTETRRRLDEFRAAFGVTWPFEIKQTEDFNAAVPPEVLDATGFPITIFLNRDHTVAAIHTGFISRAAGAEHDAVVKLFDKLAADIAASPAPEQRH